MLDRYFHRPHILARLRRNVLGRSLDDFAVYLDDRGHTLSMIQRYMRVAEHFGHWLSSEKIPPTAVNEDTLHVFLHDHLPRCHCLLSPKARCGGAIHAALRHLLRVLRKHHRISPTSISRSTPVDKAVEGFRIHLSKTCGLAASSIKVYTSYVREFLEVKYSTGPVDFTSLDAEDLITFVSDRARGIKPSTTQNIVSALRSYIRFLQLEGLCDGKLVHAIPQIPRWKQSQIPSTLTDEQLQRFLSAFDCSTLCGQRDYAMALCMVELGLRASEVAQLSLDDINWRKGTLQVPSGKSRSKLLPLPRSLGKAIATYIRDNRPKTSERKIFLRHKFRLGTPLTIGIIWHVIHNAFTSSGLSLQFSGTHVLRHTAATRMHQRGASLKEVADILGHQCLDTTAIYAKVNLPMLSTVPLPWPEV